jgi:hypothetical protein
LFCFRAVAQVLVPLVHAVAQQQLRGWRGAGLLVGWDPQKRQLQITAMPAVHSHKGIVKLGTGR